MTPVAIDQSAAVARRNAYVEAHLDLVDQIAAHLVKRLPPCFELDDLKQAGALGLIDAAARYSPSFHVPFRYYAAVRIRGEILESVRRRRYRDATHAEFDPVAHDRPDPNVIPLDSGIRTRQLARVVSRAMEGLPAADRTVLQTYYFEERTLAGVGQEMGVRQSRSSQLLQRAKRLMQRELALYGVRGLAA